MKAIFTTILSLFAAMTISAQQTVTKMVVTLNDSTQSKVKLSDVKDITFAEELDVNAVDLGLPSGTKWADRNVGASAPEEYGSYFAWAETATKRNYKQDTYQYYVDGAYQDIGWNIAMTDKDAAHVMWGGSWETPDSVHAKELVDNCTWTWTKLNDVAGYEVKGPNGNSIFLPAAGIRVSRRTSFDETGGKYACSDSDPARPMGNYYINFFDDEVEGVSYTYRWYGLTVRPIIK